MSTLNSLYHLAIRLLVSLLASHFVVVHSATQTWSELFTKDYYYYSLLYSMIIAFTLIQFVYRQTKQINKSFEIISLTKARLKAQFYRGFLLTSVLAFLLAAVLFWLNGENIFKSGYFERLYVFIVLFILSVNTIYMLYYLQTTPKIRYQLVNPDHSILAVLRSKAIEKNRPALIYHENKACFAVDFKGVKTSWSETIESSTRSLNPEYYFQINRKQIVHRAAILAVKPYRMKCLKIELIIDCTIILISSRRKTTSFKEWLNN